MAVVSDTATSTSAIDLSRLPAPTLVDLLSFETILAQLVASLQVLLPEFDATMDSDPAVKILQLAATRELMLRQQFNDRGKQLLLAYAEGANLDQIAANFNVERLVLDPGDPDNGIDPTYESDPDFLVRIQLSPEALSVAGPATAYRFHALSADATIADANASSPEPGVVVVALLSRVGDGTADADQIAAVEAALSNSVRPLTDQVIVSSAEIVPFTISAQLTLFEGPDPVIVLTSAQAKLNDYLAYSRRIGRNITRSGIIAALQVEGVLDVALAEPATNVVISGSQCGNCVGNNVVVAGYDD